MLFFYIFMYHKVYASQIYLESSFGMFCMFLSNAYLGLQGLHG